MELGRGNMRYIRVAKYRLRGVLGQAWDIALVGIIGLAEAQVGSDEETGGQLRAGA